MLITESLLLDLALLDAALDEPEAAIVETLRQLAADARAAVESYTGLRLTIAGEAPFTLTALEDDAAAEDVLSFLLLRLPPQGVDAAPAEHQLVLYASRAGAFVDLAADLSWLTGTPLSGGALDQHLSMSALAPGEPSVHAASVVDQAIGVLVERGYLALHR